MTRVLILYIVRNSGHHAAARAIEAAFRRRTPAVQTLCIDLLEHTHPKWEKVVEHVYMGTIRRTPELWEALYDNLWVDHLTFRLRQLIQGGRSESLQRLVENFNPDAVVCTQAHPLAVLSTFAARRHRNLALFGVTTDFVPHRFWISPDPHVRYVVPTEAAAARLMWLGIDQSRIRVIGIPIEVNPPAAPRAPGTRAASRRILVMGGSRGFGIRYRTVRRLDASAAEFTIDVVSGTNLRLRRMLVANRHRFRHPIRVRGYVRNAARLMRQVELMITKAGGLTLAEAMSIGLPVLIVRPLPGQERGNTQVMVHHGAALHVKNERDVARSVTLLLKNPELLAMMHRGALALGRPRAADEIAQYVLEDLVQRPSG